MNNLEKNNEISYAKKVVISLVKSPLYNGTSHKLDTELKEFFQDVKTFQKNSFFHLKSLQNQNITYQFKIVDVEPSDLESFKIDNSNTTLTQTEESIHNLWIWPNKNIKSSAILENYVNQIEKAIKYYEINHKSNSSSLPIMLLYGPNGCGKTLSVESLCSKLSLHLCKINSVNLAGESASAVEKRIEIFMQQSVNYGP